MALFGCLRCLVVPLWLVGGLLVSFPLTIAEAAPSSSRHTATIARISKERAAVEANLRSLKQQLQEYQTRLTQVSRKEAQSFKALEAIRGKITVLEKMITDNQRYLAELDADIDHLQNELEGNRQVYGQLSDDFRRTAISVYKYGGNRDVEHIFGASSVNDALVRAQYMGFFTRAVSHNVNELQAAAVRLEENREALEQTYEQKMAMVKEQERQLQQWSASKKEKEQVLVTLKKNKQEYSKQLSIAQKKRQQLQARIEGLIIAEQRAIEAEMERQRKLAEARRVAAEKRARERAEAERRAAAQREAERLAAERQAKARAAAEGKKASRSKQEKEEVALKPAPSVTKPLPAEPQRREEPIVEEADELAAISVNFDKAYGSLPLPVQGGVVTRRFGSVHDKDLNIVTTSNGIDISVPAGTPVRAVSGGKVVQIAFLPTFGNIVILRHTNSYLTVYANLGSLQVAKNEVVKSQQQLGVVGKSSDGASMLHFEIWKGRTKQNPAKWLR
uniref:Membrane-bound metallopeptidase-like protein n=1 Tax=Chlorobium chlorochromatii (strain CaD3) TaxID=340177 RepID=Q3AR33_CHLCH